MDFLQLQCGGSRQESGEHLVLVLSCCQSFGGYGRGDGLDTGQRVGNYVVLAGYVANIRCELRDVIQAVKLPWRTFVFLLLEGEGLWLMVRQDGEIPGFLHVAEVSHSLIDRQELPLNPQLTVGWDFSILNAHFGNCPYYPLYFIHFNAKRLKQGINHSTHARNFKTTHLFALSLLSLTLFISTVSSSS